MLKSQVLTGGRMKAGGVKFADTPDEAERAPRRSSGWRSTARCRAACSSTARRVAQEYFAAVTWDGTRKRPVLIFSDMGGIDIEEVAETHPDHVGRGHFSTLLPFSDFDAKEAIARSA